MLAAIAKTAARLCEAYDALIFLADADQARLVARYGRLKTTLKLGEGQPLGRHGVGQRAILERRTIHVRDVSKTARAEFSESRVALAPLGVRTILATPLLRDGAAIGSIVIRRTKVRPFTPGQIALLKTFADQAAIAIENARLSQALEARNADLSEALDQQTATSQILGVISRSPTNAQPVFDAIAESAARLCDGLFGFVTRFDGTLIHFAAHHNMGPAALEAIGRSYPMAADRESINGLALIDRRVIHVREVDSDPDVPSRGREVARALGFKTVVAVPMLRDGQAIGAISVARSEAKAFTTAQVDLLKTFADQAVIAIENVRLFKELESRNGELTEALNEKTATSEILRVISNSPTDVHPVLEAVAESAERLCEADLASVFRFDGELIHHAAQHGRTSDEVESARRAFPQPPHRRSVTARAILARSVVQIADVAEDAEVEDSLRIFRTVLSAPMIREGRPLGAITVARRVVRPFTEGQVALLQTFADQAVIAIENVRLFTELQARNRELTEALEQQTATSEILRVISRSPTDVQPVFDTIAERAMRLCGGAFGWVMPFDGGLLHLAALANLTPEGADALRQAFPVAPSRGTTAGRTILTGDVVQIPDVLNDPEYGMKDLARTADYRSALTAPMLHQGRVIGVISVTRREPGAFSQEQIRLLRTFADQAVIAIENVRLFTELEARNSELRVALEQQTATSEILQVISSSPTDLQPIFDAIASSATRLCDAAFCVVFRFDGEMISVAADDGRAPGTLDIIRSAYPSPPGRQSISALAIHERRVICMADLQASEEYPHLAERARAIGYRSILAVPMLRGEAAIGAINVARLDVTPFTETQIALLQTFADQAVIAIENVRLFKELEARNSDLTEALEQQTATSEILRVISSSPTNVQPVFDAIADAAMRLCGAASSLVTTFDGELLHLVAQAAISPVAAEMVRGVYPRRPGRGFATGRAIVTCAVVQIPDLTADAEFELRDVARQVDFRSILAVPMLRDGIPIGTINVHKPEPGAFTDKQTALLQTFADQAVIAIQNVRLFTELEARNRDVTEALEQQTATSEILQVISSSPTDLQPVFDIIAESAVKLCGAEVGLVTRFDGELVSIGAVYGTSEAGLDAMRRVYPMPPSRASAGARAVHECAIAHIPDVLAEEGYSVHEAALAAGFRSALGVPMLREGRAIGSIAIGRAIPGEFNEGQIKLLCTFADQAVIAVENVRLFKELEARTGDLTRSVDKLTALGEVSHALSSTLEVETVLDTIVSHASQLAGGAGCAIYEYEEATEQFELRATHGYDAGFVEALRAAPLRRGEGLMGRAAEVGEAIQVPDISRPGAYESSLRDALTRFGYRALLSVPLLREEQIIGSLSLTRKEPGEYAPEVIEVLKTFATQSALAIQNARLFREIADKSRQLEVASRHKSEFLANMSHELRTPLNAIIGFSEVLNERMFGELNEKQDEYMRDIHASGTHLLSLINDILDLSKVEAGRMELELTDFDLPMALDNALTLVRERASRRGVTLKLTVGDGVGAIRGDERKMKQVLLNLLSNAIKFTPEGGRIEVAAVRDDGAVEVSVSDTGVGIAPEDLEAVFEEFRQVGASAAKQEGTGLGLALCRKFIELHGGKIWATSAVGSGSTFTFRLPTGQ